MNGRIIDMKEKNPCMKKGNKKTPPV